MKQTHALSNEERRLQAELELARVSLRHMNERLDEIEQEIEHTARVALLEAERRVHWRDA